VVILFAVTKEAEKVLKAATDSSEARDKFTWIASDGWTSLIPTKKSDTSYLGQLKRKKLSLLNIQALCNAYESNNCKATAVTHTKRIDRNLLRKETSFVCYTSSVLRKSRHMKQKEKITRCC